MKIALGCDHGALELKNALIPFLRSLGHSVEDFGTYTLESCDYPDYAVAAAQAVADGDCDRGIVLCTTGIGVSIAANKVRGIRCALLSDLNSARMTRLHNDTNMMALGAGVVSQDLAFAIVDVWLSTPFSNEDRHQRRIDKVMSCERGLKKKRRTPKRGRRHSPLVSRILTFIISLVFVLSLIITPIATYVTSIADPSYLVDILFASGLFGDAQTPSDDTETGNTETDDTETGNTETDDTETGNTETDDTETDNTETDDTETDNTETDNTETDNTETDNTETDNTETDNTGTEGGEPATIAEVDSDIPVGGDQPDPAVDSETSTSTEANETDTSTDGNETDTSTDGSETDTPSGSEDATPPADNSQSSSPDASATQALLAALQGMIGSDMMDEDTLHTMLNIPDDTPIDTALLSEKLVESEAAQALVSAYVSDAMDAAMGVEKEPSLTSDTVMSIVTPHIGELADIVEECLPEGTTVDRTALEEATLQALQESLPAIVETLPDVSEAADALSEQAPMLGKVLDALKFIRTGALRASALLLVVVLTIALCLFRLPGLIGLRCVGICGIIGAALCGIIYLLLGMPYLQNYLAETLGQTGALITQFAGGVAHEFGVCAVIYGVFGLLLVLGTTIFRGFFGMLFDAIFSRN